MEFSSNSIGLILKSQDHDSKYLSKIVESLKHDIEKDRIKGLLNVGKDICINNLDISLNLLNNHEREMKSEEYDRYVLNRLNFVYFLKELLKIENKFLELKLKNN